MSHIKWKRRFMLPLMEELDSYRRRGVELFLDGRPSSPRTIARACIIAEGGGYMRDYTEDERGRIARVNFDLIREVPRYKCGHTRAGKPLNSRKRQK